MSDLNVVVLKGILVDEPNLREVGSGKVVSFCIANHGFKEDDVSFIQCSAWNMGNRKLAEVISKHFAKGSHIIVEGRLKQDRWETNEGEKRSNIKVLVSDFKFDGRKGSDSNSNGSSSEEGAL